MTKEELEYEFVTSFNHLAEEAHQTSVDKGWWDERLELIEVAKSHSEDLGKFAENTIAAMGIALEHSELTESLEGIRNDVNDDKIPDFSMEEAEAADTIIRLMDRGVSRNLRIAEAIIAKMEMNKTRSYKHGGKKI